MKRPAAEVAAATIVHYLVTSTNIDVMARFTEIEKAMQGLIDEARVMSTMLMIETGGILVVVDAIAAMTPRELYDGVKIMLLSGDHVDTDESMQEILAKIQDVMRKAR